MNALEQIYTDKQVHCIDMQDFKINPGQEALGSNVSSNVPVVLGATEDELVANCNSNIVYGGKYWRILMVMSSLGLLVGGSSATLLGRLYFVNGGSRRWVYACIESIGWPVLLVPLAVSNLVRGGATWRCVCRPTPKLLLIFVFMGFLTTLDNLMYAWGTSYLPVSTNSLLCSTQLAFGVIFAYFLVRQRITAFTLNSVFLIITSAVLLGLGDESKSMKNEEGPRATTPRQYVIGYIVTIAASALYALMLTLLELIYRRIGAGAGAGGESRIQFQMVVEVQAFISAAATVFSMMGMWANNDFRGMGKEAHEFGLGVGVYVAVLVGAGIGWQLFILGGAGIIFLASSLMSCVFMTAIIPILPLLGVLFFHDTFSFHKGISIVLSVWGFCSYIYGGYINYRAQQAHASNQTAPLP